jgi:hypothetical protein
MLVYLTTTVGTNAPGFYYWDSPGNAWVGVRGKEGGTLDEAYDFGGPGVGRTIIADAGAVTIAGTDGLVSTGVAGSGALMPSGAGVRMVWNPRKAAFRVGEALTDEWDDDNVGLYSIALGNGSRATELGAVSIGTFNLATNVLAFALGSNTIASGQRSTAFGDFTIASGFRSTSFGNQTTASANLSTAFGHNTTASGNSSTAFGSSNVASGTVTTSFGRQNTASSYGETVIGIGATTYTPSFNGTTQFRAVHANDRLFVIGNAIDTNNNNTVDDSERSDAMIVLKNGLTRLPSMDNAMIDAADGKTVVTKEYLQDRSSGTLDQAYDFGGPGAGNTIIADAGAVTIAGTDGLVSTGILGSGAVAPSGTGTRMVWNPRKGSFRAGDVIGPMWDDVNIGFASVAFGTDTTASGDSSTAFGFNSSASGPRSTAFGYYTIASGIGATAFNYETTASGQGATSFGYQSTANALAATAFGDSTIASNVSSTAFGTITTASGTSSTSFGTFTTASGTTSTAFGTSNAASSYGETVIGIGATTYTPSADGATQFRAANATDRLFVIGNAIDANNNNTVDAAERRDAMVVLKNGNVGLGTSTPQTRLEVVSPNVTTTGTARGNLHVMSNDPQDIDVGGSISIGGYNNNAANAMRVFGTIEGRKTNATSTSSSGYLAFKTNNANTLAERMRITNSGNVGIGTTSPSQTLTVVPSGSGATGFSYNANAHMVLDKAGGNAYIAITTDDDRSSGILFANGINNSHGGIHYNILGTYDLRFRTGGNTTRMTITQTGDVGIGTPIPGGQFQLSLDQGRKPGTTTWTVTSDQRLKTVQGYYERGLPEILQLNPIRYHYKNLGDKVFEDEVLQTEYAGFLAQEVQKQFPEAVGVDRDGFLNFNMHPILVASINAFKELHKKYETLAQENKALKNTLEQIIQRLEKLEQEK